MEKNFPTVLSTHKSNETALPGIYHAYSDQMCNMPFSELGLKFLLNQLEGVAQLVADFPPATPTTITDTHTLYYLDNMANLMLNCIDNRRSYTTRKNQAIWDAPLYKSYNFKIMLDLGFLYNCSHSVKKLDGVALLIEVPPSANSTTTYCSN